MYVEVQNVGDVWLLKLVDRSACQSAIGGLSYSVYKLKTVNLFQLVQLRMPASLYTT